jgi:carbohydrate-binding DOMON domain-containing protein
LGQVLDSVLDLGLEWVSGPAQASAVASVDLTRTLSALPVQVKAIVAPRTALMVRKWTCQNLAVAGTRVTTKTTLKNGVKTETITKEKDGIILEKVDPKFETSHMF